MLGDRDESPGLRLRPGNMPPQITHAVAESAAMHSRSEGWMPGVILRFVTEDGGEFAGVIPVGTELWDIVISMMYAAERAHQDMEAGWVE